MGSGSQPYWMDDVELFFFNILDMFSLHTWETVLSSFLLSYSSVDAAFIVIYQLS